jgi:hypothetical protein
MSTKELSSVTKLPPRERYSYSIKRFADWYEVWILARGDTWEPLRDRAHSGRLYLWPHPDLAELFAERMGYGDCHPACIDLGAWMNDWMSRIAQEEPPISEVSIFASHDEVDEIVSLTKFREDLEHELERY